MANIKKDVDIANVTVDKKRHKSTGVSIDLIKDKITINYDILALNASNVELFKHGQDNVEIESDRFSETHIANFITALIALVQAELPNS